MADILSAFAALGLPAGERRVPIHQDAHDVQNELTAWFGSDLLTE